MSAKPRIEMAVVDLDAVSRPAFEVTQESRFVILEPKHHRACSCADCRVTFQKANIHYEVPGAPYGVTSACGEYFGREMLSMIGAPLFSGTDGYGKPREVTCARCLDAMRREMNP